MTIAKRSESSLPGIRLSIAAVIISLGGSANFAYHLIITNPAQAAFLSFVNESFYEKHNTVLSFKQLETVWSLVVSILYWGTIIGALLIQVASHKLGRKHGLTVANSLQAIAIAISIYSYFQKDYIIYTGSRFLLGIGQALSLGIGPMYIMECSPTRCRGVISMSTSLILQTFIVVAAILAMPKIWGNVDDWWKLYAVELVELCMVIGLSQFLPESPPVLEAANKHEEARKSLQFYHGIPKDEADKLLNKEHEDQEKNNAPAMGLLEVFRDPMSRRGTMLGCMVMLTMTFSGIVAVNAFAVEILMGTGLDIEAASYANVGICLFSVLGVITSSFIIDRFGRRPLLIYGIGANALVNVSIASLMYGFDKTQNPTLGWTLVGMICVYIVIGCITLFPISFFITGELLDGPARPAAQTWANLMMSAGRSVLLAIFLPLKLMIGSAASYLILFFPPMLFCAFYLHYNLPETKGKTYPEVLKEYENLPGKKKILTLVQA